MKKTKVKKITLQCHAKNKNTVPEFCVRRRRRWGRNRGPATSGEKHRQRKEKRKSPEARGGSGEPPGKENYLWCRPKQADDTRMAGALRQNQRMLSKRPRSSATGPARSWEQGGAFWTERRRLRCATSSPNSMPRVKPRMRPKWSGESKALPDECSLRAAQ